MSEETTDTPTIARANLGSKNRQGDADGVLGALEDLARNRLPLPQTVRVHNARKVLEAAIREREELRSELIRQYDESGEGWQNSEDAPEELVEKIGELMGATELGGTLSLTGDLIGLSDVVIRSDVNTAFAQFSGGVSGASGANYTAFGPSHATNPGLHRWRNATTDTMTLSSAGDLSVSGTGTHTFAGRVQVTSTNTVVQFIATGFDNSTASGMRIDLQRNTNATTPAAGHILMQALGGTGYRVWPDDAGLLRIHTDDPTNANDTAGTVVGDQTSDARVKEHVTPFEAVDEALQRVVDAPLHLYRFRDDPRRPGKVMLGYVIREEDRGGWFSMNDHRPDNMAALDVANVVGHHAGAIKALASREARLERALRETFEANPGLVIPASAAALLG